MDRRTKKILLGSFTLLASVLVGAALYVRVTLTRSVPVTEGALALAGLEGPVTITYDSLGIPQIWAQTADDAFFSLGFQHAADRMFQMDFARRVSQGMLSEALGEATLDIDIKQRTIGHHRMARAALPALSEHTRTRLQAYADGINAYHRSGRNLTFEFLLLRTEFDEWTVLDCLSLFSFQTWFSDAIQNRDDLFVWLDEELGEEKAASLLLPYPDWAPYTVPSRQNIGFNYPPAPVRTERGSKLSRIQRREPALFQVNHVSSSPASRNLPGKLRDAMAGKLLADESWGLAPGAGSNGWVVAAEKSASGKPLLAGDPHLDVTRLPQFWYALGMHIAEDGADAFGITTPGLPFIAMGHNNAAAWTFTAAGIDLTDYFMERINPDDSSEYLSPSGWRKFRELTDTIIVAGLDTPVVIQSRYTERGPLAANEDLFSGVYSVRWAGAEMDLAASLANALELQSVQDFETFRRVVTGLGALDANWIYSDTAGNIGYQLGTPVPIRPAGSVNLALAGWEKGQSWDGFRELRETPWALNPEQGWLANCNNKQDQPNLDYELGGAFFADRILRVSEYLSEKDIYALADMRTLQLERRDNYFLRWARELPALLDEIGETERAEKLRSWNGSAGTQSVETALIAEFLLQLKQLTFSDELGPQTKRLKRIWVDQIYHSADTSWFDDITTEDVVESRSEVARRALRNALAVVGGQEWGDMHSLTMEHPLSIVPILSGYLGLKRGPWSRGGTGGTVNASYYSDIASGEYRTLAAPSWRMLIDMARPDIALVCLPAGNSGNPLSEHFFDFNEMWREGGYWEVSLDSADTHSRAVSTLNLIPVQAVRQR
ncbi:MAG: penicillin acylase family protein [Candidatus Zixiibacteriota bacterium]